MPSQSTAVKSGSQIADHSVHCSSYLSKMKIELVRDLIKNIPLLTDTNLEEIFKFCICVKKVYDLSLVTDFEYVSWVLGC
jgi:hypothetical protein